jgi:hypothetical protein
MSMVGGAVGHAIGHAASAATHKRASQHAAAATEAEEHDGGGGELFVIAHPSGFFSVHHFEIFANDSHLAQLFRCPSGSPTPLLLMSMYICVFQSELTRRCISFCVV